MVENGDTESPEDVLPQEVVAELRRRAKRHIAIPEDREQSILSDAHSYLRSQKPRKGQSDHRKRVAGFVSVGSLAAVLLFILIPNRFGSPDRGDSEARLASETLDSTVAEASEKGYADMENGQDINGDGRLDILDAFALARSVNRRELIGTRGDFDHNGVVDMEDVDLIAMAAVTL